MVLDVFSVYVNKALLGHCVIKVTKGSNVIYKGKRKNSINDNYRVILYAIPLIIETFL